MHIFIFLDTFRTQVSKDLTYYVLSSLRRMQEKAKKEKKKVS